MKAILFIILLISSINYNTVYSASMKEHNASNISEYENILKSEIKEQAEDFQVNLKASVINDKSKIDKEIGSSLENVRQSLRGTIHHMNLGDIEVKMKLNLNSLEVTHLIDYKNTNKDFNKAENIINKFIEDNINESMSDYDKMYKAYEFTINKLNYGTVGNVNKERNMIEGLNGNPVVCEAYAFLFHQLMQSMNIESQIVLGDADNIAHAWNIVKLNNKWLHVDPTWGDSPDGSVNMDYFLVTDKEIKSLGNRVIEKGSPKSTLKLAERDKNFSSTDVENNASEPKDSEPTDVKRSTPSSLVIAGIILTFLIVIIKLSII